MRIRDIVFLLSFPLLACSCGTPLADEESGGKAMVTFTVRAAGASTKTTWGDNYDSESATGNESVIDMGKFQALVFDTADKYIGHIRIVSYTESDGSYNVTGLLDIDESCIQDSKLSGKIVVLTNYDTAVSGISSLSDIGTDAFSYESHKTEDIAAGAAAIPMFGVSQFTDLPISTSGHIDMGIVYMLRAMAKIRVRLNLDSNGDGTVSSDEEFAISSVTLTNCNKTGFIVPKGYATVSSTTELTMMDPPDDGTFNQYPSSDGTPETGTLTLQKESDTEYFLYVPEYKISNGRPSFSIKFDFQTDADSEYTFDFDVYDSGKSTSADYDIERNNIYTFTIKKNKGKLYIVSGDWANTFNNEYTFS